MSGQSRSKAWLLGPRAENQEILERLILEAFRDYCYWRKNFHPEDSAYVTAGDRQDRAFQEYHQELRDGLFEMLSRLKRSVPFFSPRYLGHMLTDLLMPGMLGYIGAMFYNQNNIYEEVSNVTMQLEVEAVQKLAAMLHLPHSTAWGHLSSGGTAAIMESLWVARNLRLLPYQVALALDEARGDDAKNLANLPTGKGGPFAAVRDRGLLRALSVDEVVSLQAELDRLCQTRRGLARLVEEKSVGYLGLTDFTRVCERALGQQFPTTFKVLISKNAHYSLRKGTSIVGLGEHHLEILPLDGSLRLDVEQIQDAIDRCHGREECVLAVVGVYGSTEVSAIDDFEKLLEIRQRVRGGGKGDFWLHADACYGGYAAAMSHPPTDAVGLAAFLAELARELPGGRDGVAWDEGRCGRWLANTRALGSCDAVSIDPHKLGYIPYPAGAVLYRDYRVREFVRCDAPYLNAAPAPQKAGGVADDPPAFWHTPNMGRYTLEGSRPGACGAALWLAHQTVPLDRTGHGLMVAQSVLAARHLQGVLKEKLPCGQGNGVGCSFLASEPDLNMLCYTFPARIDGEAVPLAVVNRAIERVYTEFMPTEAHPTQTRDFVLAKTHLDVKDYGEEFLGLALERLGLPPKLVPQGEIGTRGNPWRDDHKITVVRTVVMGPFLPHASARAQGQVEGLAGKYAEALGRELGRIMLELLDAPVPQGRRPSLKYPVLVVEDAPDTQAELCRQLVEVSFDGHPELVRRAATVEGAKSLAGEQFAGGVRVGPGVSAAVVDIQLDRLEGGLEFLEFALPLPEFRGAVVFTERGSADIRGKVLALANRTGKVVVFRSKPVRLRGRFQEQLNWVMEDLWKILSIGQAQP